MTDTALQTADRSTFIGGSDVAAILNISPWASPVQLYEKKVNPPTPTAHEANRKEKRRGKRWEAVVAEMLVEELEARGHKVKIVAANKRYTDPTVPYFACEIDFEILLDDDTEITNVELKTVHPYKSNEWGEEGTDESPVWYSAQGMWGLGITGRHMCIVAALFGADELKVYFVERDEETIVAMRERANAFWQNHVVPKIPPAPTTLADLTLLYPKDSNGPALLADDELTAKLLRMRAIDREIKARTAEYELLEFEVKRVMQDCSELVVAGATAATWKQRSHSWLDQAALKEEHPDIHKRLMRKGTSRVFTLKSFSWKGIE